MIFEDQEKQMAKIITKFNQKDGTKIKDNKVFFNQHYEDI